MRVFTTGFLLFLAFALFSRWYYVCKILHQCGDRPVTTRPMTLSLTDGDSTVLKGYEQFAFRPNTAQPLLSPNNQQFLEKTAAFLQHPPQRTLTLTGRYLESEKSTPAGIFENIGIARAAYIERLLEKLGIDESRIHIDHQIVSGQTLHEPVAFSLNTQKPDDYQKLEYRFEDNTFSDANFAFNSAEFIPGDAFLLYADSVKSYLADHPEKILSITGHTDSIDTEKYNYNLGLMRAKSAAQYFRELGVKAKIITNSKGETQPVAPNSKPDGSDNPEGRQKNRRVNFKITDADMNQ